MFQCLHPSIPHTWILDFKYFIQSSHTCFSTGNCARWVKSVFSGQKDNRVKCYFCNGCLSCTRNLKTMFMSSTRNGFHAVNTFWKKTKLSRLFLIPVPSFRTSINRSRGLGKLSCGVFCRVFRLKTVLAWQIVVNQFRHVSKVHRAATGLWQYFCYF